MLDVFKAYATDTTAEVEGNWQDFNGAKLLIARANNRKYNREVVARYEKYKEAFDKGGDVAEKAGEDFTVELMAETILLGWQDVAYMGAPIEYSKENARKLLAIRDFRAEVAKFADSIEYFRLKVEDEQVKN